MDLYVFPELHKTPDGALEAEFYAFKIPDSTFLVFQATVRTCRGPCEPVICNDKGRGHAHFPSWGRRRRDVNPAENVSEEDTIHEEPAVSHDDFNVSESVLQAVVSTPPTPLSSTPPASVLSARSASPSFDETGNEAEVPVSESAAPEEEVHELFRVYMSRAEVPDPPETKPSSSSAARMTREEVMTRPSLSTPFDRVCVSQSGYYALVTAITVLTTLVLSMGVAGTIVLRKSHLNKIIQ